MFLLQVFGDVVKCINGETSQIATSKFPQFPRRRSIVESKLVFRYGMYGQDEASVGTGDGTHTQQQKMKYKTKKLGPKDWRIIIGKEQGKGMVETS